MFLNTISSQLEDVIPKKNQPKLPKFGDAFDQAAKNIYLQRKQKDCKIGSIHRNHLNFAREMKAFKSVDVPENKLRASASVREFKNPDRLGLKQPQWNQSNYVPPTDYNRQLSQDALRFEIRSKLRDWQMPKAISPRNYTGTETRNKLYNWNSSSVVSSPKPIYADQREKSLKNSRSQTIQRMYLDNKYTMNPTEQISARNRALVEQKEADEALRQKILAENEAEFATQSEQKVEAIVYRSINNYKLALKQSEVYKEAEIFTHKPDIKATVPVKKMKEYYHTGVFEVKTFTKYSQRADAEGVTTSGKGGNEFHKDLQPITYEKGVWSCCMCEERDDPGCHVRWVDLLRWQTNIL